jgi:hypothetical protein
MLDRPRRLPHEHHPLPCVTAEDRMRTLDVAALLTSRAGALGTLEGRK